MTKEMFLREMSGKLHQLPEKEVKQQLSYYEEMLEDMIEDGIAEEEAVAKIGNINEIVEEILCEQPLPALVKNRMRPKNGWTVAAVTVAILGAPLWIPLLFALVLTAGAVVLAIGAVILSLFVVVLAFACTGVLIMIRGFCLFTVSGNYAVFGVGVGLFMLGLTCLAALATKYSAVGLYRGGRWLYRAVKGLLVVKEG